MASLAKFCKIPTRLRQNNYLYLYNIVRNSATRDFKAGPYPETEEEKVKAAEKYKILKEDYKPIPDNGSGHGDYPDLPMISGDSRDPNYPWDFPELKRNFNEPLHIDANIIGEDRWDPNVKLRYPMYVYWLSFLGTMTGAAIIFYIFESFKYVQPVARKQFPAADKTYYTFESGK